MASESHSLCRYLLAEALELARRRFTTEEIRSAWAYDVSGGRANQFEFHGPRDYYDHDVKMSDCLWSAKANGWFGLMDKLDDETAAPQVQP
jgi:hypothetical protein